MSAAPVTPNRDVKEGEEEPSTLEFGSSTPGTLARTGSISSPLVIFSSEVISLGKKHFDFGDISEEDDSMISESERLGISRAAYYSSDDEDSMSSSVSARIGISRPSYDVPEGDIPLSPMNPFLEPKPPEPAHLEEEEEDPSVNLDWKFERSSPSVLADIPELQADDEERPDGIARMVHKSTADGHYLVSSRPLDSPMDGIRYSLTEGKRGMTDPMRRASESRLLSPKSRPSTPRSASVPAAEMATDIVASVSPTDASFKIFLLLIQPKSRIFELIQVIYSPSVTTVGDVLSMIPGNATEPALASQQYTGLCRPKNGIEITNTEMMASGSHEELDCAKITKGEILVAIPYGYTGKTSSAISKPILSNPKIKKLLKRSDPLAAKGKKSKKARARQRRSKIASTVATVQEVNEDELASSSPLSAAAAAVVAAATAAETQTSDRGLPTPLPEESADIATEDAPSSQGRPVKSVEHGMDTKPSLQRVDFDESVDSISSGYSENELVASLNTSFTFQPGTSKTQSSKRQLRNRRKLYMLRMAAAVFAFLICRYIMDEEFDDEEGEDPHAIDPVLGFLGLFQALVFFFAMLKMQDFSDEKKQSVSEKPTAKKAPLPAT